MPEVDGEAISQLPVVTSVVDDDLFVVVASGATSGIAASDMPGGGGGSGTEILSPSIVSGNTTATGSQASTASSVSSDIYHVDGGDFTVSAGNVTNSGLPGGLYFYFNGGDVVLSAGTVTVSGSHEMAVVQAGSIEIAGGDAVLDPGGADAYSVLAGNAELAGGSSATLDGAGVNTGAEVEAEGATYQKGGRLYGQGGAGATDHLGGDVYWLGGVGAGTGKGGLVLLQGGSAATNELGGYVQLLAPTNEPTFLVGCDAAGEPVIGFFDKSGSADLTTVQPSGNSSTITAEQIWQKLAAIGLVEDTA